ncbi:ATP-binding protein [Citricoccus nitrophenolicus]|uniref:ATP-binding protein n=1 Tax=Citricoccus nitrophenolicus TaxID=863575 RepID=A0ABV0ID57_9MICC
MAACCHKAALEGRWSTTIRYFSGPTLLVIDEPGYFALPTAAASALFQFPNQRYLKTRFVITTNRPIGACAELMVVDGIVMLPVG